MVDAEGVSYFAPRDSSGCRFGCMFLWMRAKCDQAVRVSGTSVVSNVAMLELITSRISSAIKAQERDVGPIVDDFLRAFAAGEANNP